MPNDYFQFKKFIINQDRCAMKVGTDGVLLGAWIKAKGAEKILDVGTGTGLIALMLAQKSTAKIDGLEIDQVAAEQATENVNLTSWKDRVNIICDSFQNYSKKENLYDLIVCNPPYFSDSLHAPDLKRSLARHNHKLSITDIFTGVQNLLDITGRFCIILPCLEYNKIKEIYKKSGMSVNRSTLIFPAPEKNANRIMLEYSFKNKSCEESQLIIEKYGRHQYSEEYIDLTKDYYLKF